MSINRSLGKSKQNSLFWDVLSCPDITLSRLQGICNNFLLVQNHLTGGELDCNILLAFLLCATLSSSKNPLIRILCCNFLPQFLSHTTPEDNSNVTSPKRNIQGNEAIITIPGVLGHCSLSGTKRDLNSVTTHLSQLQQSLLVTVPCLSRSENHRKW